MPFRVQVTRCQTTIIPPPSDIIPDAERWWYEDAVTVDLSTAFAGYTQQPNCGYDFAFQLRWEKFPGSYQPLPVEAIANLPSSEVYLQKCSDAGNPLQADFECQGPPKEKNMRFRVIATLTEDPSFNQDASVYFDFQVKNVCLLDEISWVDTIENEVEYVIRSFPQPLFLTPTYAQTYERCPVSCTLND